MWFSSLNLGCLGTSPNALNISSPLPFCPLPLFLLFFSFPLLHNWSQQMIAAPWAWFCFLPDKSELLLSSTSKCLLIGLVRLSNSDSFLSNNAGPLPYNIKCIEVTDVLNWCFIKNVTLIEERKIFCFMRDKTVLLQVLNENLRIRQSPGNKKITFCGNMLSWGIFIRLKRERKKGNTQKQIRGSTYKNKIVEDNWNF